jgi:Outer membrane protein beta-barrel domain
MKKIFIVLTLAVTAITSTYAQQTLRVDPRTKFYVGPKVGYNYANVYDTQGENFNADGRVGFVAGVFFTIPVGKFIGIQPELLFSQKGFQATGILLGSPYVLSRTTNYIDVPVLFSVKPGRVITLLAGPQFSYLMRQKDAFESSTLNTAQAQEFRNDDIRKNTLSFLGGIDFNLNKFVLGTRMGWDVLNNNGDGTSTTPRYKNVWLQATVAYRL